MVLSGAHRSVLRLGVIMLAWIVLSGCEEGSGIYQPKELLIAKKIVVMPAVSSAGPGGRNCQAGLLLTSLAQLGRYQVEGPGQIRRALAASPGKSQIELAGELGIDLFAVCEVADFRWTVEHKSQSYYFGRSTWTETKYHVGIAFRLVGPDGRLVYSATGVAESKDGFGPTTIAATETAVQPLGRFLEKNPARKEPADEK